MNLFTKYAQNKEEASISNQMRNQRHKLFVDFALKEYSANEKITILDVGGTEEYWQKMELDNSKFDVILLNLEAVEVKQSNFKSVKGDATNLEEYSNDQFDIVFSNSVIEHLFTFNSQNAMAQEVQRVGRKHFI